MKDNDTFPQAFNRREFLAASGKGIAAATVASLLSAQLTGCGSSSASTASGSWVTSRANDFTLSGDYIYVNNSTLGTTLRTVQERMEQVNKIIAEGCNVDRFVSDIIMAMSPILDSFIKLVNGHVHPTTKGRYAGFVSSVTEGMSLIANGITFSGGDVIITTDHEHTGAFTMWKLQADRFGARVIQVPLLDPSDTEFNWRENLVQRFRQACLSAPGAVRVLSFPAITCSTGHILPVRDICAVSKSFGAISVVDAAQAFTVIPLDVQAFDCDAMVVNGHKYLCGPVGSGFVTVHPRFTATLSSLWPTIVDDNYYHPENLARHYPYRKGGVQAYTNILPLADALAQLLRLGMETIASRLSGIGIRFRECLAAYPDHFELITPMDAESGSVMTCFRVKGIASQTVFETLRDTYKIHGKHATEGFAADNAGNINGAVRLSPHYYLSETEFLYIKNALYKIAGIT
jgi:selenocysteine lyase/cysteine desulfurase